MSCLDKQRKRFICIVGADNINIDNVSLLSSSGFTFALILHDKDINDKGEKKFNHLHIILMSNKILRGKQVLKRLADIFECDYNNIQVDECLSVVGSIQYLIHKNDINKYQYDRNDIITNLKADLLESYLNADIEAKTELTSSSLIDLILSSTNRVDLIKKIGLGNYSTYRNTINDIIQCLGVSL